MNGFVMQKTDFPYVAAIVDDASTDNAQQVVTGFIEKNFVTKDSEEAYRKETDYGTILFARHKENPNCFFAVILLKENHYSQKKKKIHYLSRWIYNSEYIALCEGDDYWTDPQKLQKQVDHLESHDDCVMVACAARWEVDGNLVDKKPISLTPRYLTTEEVIQGGGRYLPTCSLLYRRFFMDRIPEWRMKANVGDYPLQIQGTLEGGLFYFPDVMCVYRRGHPGSWTYRNILNNPQLKSKHQRAEINWMKELDRSTDHQYQKAIYQYLLPAFPKLFSRKVVSVSEYFRAVVVAGTFVDFKRMMKKIIKRILRFDDVREN